MSINSALSSGNYTNLRKNSFHASQYLCLWPNDIVFSSTLSAAFSGDSYAAVTFGSTLSGDSADIEVGMRVIIGPSNDIDDAIAKARSNNGAFDGRARAVVSGSTLYINETSATLASGSYVWVIRDYPVADKLARESGGTYYKDWDKTFVQLPPIIGNVQTAYAGICSGSPEVFTVSFAPTAIAGTDGASVAGWSWTIPTGGTITSGGSTSQNITVEFDAGTYDVVLEVDDGPRTTTMHIAVFAVPSDLSSVVSLGFAGAEIDADIDSGYSARVEAFEDLSSALDNTLCVIFDVSRYGTTETEIDTNIRMVGRLSKESNRTEIDANYSTVRTAQFDIVGAGGMLSRIAAPVITITDNATPTIWDEINVATYWRVMAYTLQEHSTYLLTHSLEFSEASSTYRLSVWGVNGDDLLGEMNATAGSIGASVEFRADGRTYVNRRATQLTSTARNALTTVANWTNQDFIALSIDRDLEQQVGAVNAAGGTYLSSTNSVQEYLSQAPGIAPEGAVGKRTLPGQALGTDLSKSASETELNTRTGNYFAEQNPTTELSVTLPDGYGWLTPSRAQWYTWTLTAADTNLRGLAYTTSERWLLVRVTTRHDNNTGTKSVEHVYQLEVAGTAGQTIEPPSSTEISDPLPGIPPIIGLPDLGFSWPDVIGDIPTAPPPFWQGEEIPADGNAVVVINAYGVWSTTDFKTTAPAWRNVTPDLPDGYTIRDGKIGFVTEYYIVASDGTESVIFYTENVFGSNITWSQSGTLTGVFTEVEPGGTRGGIFAKGLLDSENLTWCYHFDFSLGQLGWYAVTAGTYSGGAWQPTDRRLGNIDQRMINIGRNVDLLAGNSTITRCDMTYHLEKGRIVFPSGTGIQFDHVLDSTITVDYLQRIQTVTEATEADPNTWTMSVLNVTEADYIEVFLISSNGQTSGSPGFSGDCTIYSLTLSGTGENPFGQSNCSQE